MLNATKGKIGKGKSFFEEAFGKNIDEFMDILWMPETFIIYRFKYKENLTIDWRKKFKSLTEQQLDEAKQIIAHNRFTDADINQCSNKDVRELLQFYCIRRDH